MQELHNELLPELRSRNFPLRFISNLVPTLTLLLFIFVDTFVSFIARVISLKGRQSRQIDVVVRLAYLNKIHLNYVKLS